MGIVELLYTIAKKYKETHTISLGKTKLLKLAYLAELFHKRNTGQRLTSSPWVFWHFGPYIREYPDILKSPAFYQAKQTTENDFIPIDINYEYHSPKVDPVSEASILRAMEFSDDDLNDILDYVYFDTEPMINVSQRGEALNFDCVRPASEVKVKKYVLTDEIKKNIKHKIEEWERQKNAKR